MSGKPRIPATEIKNKKKDAIKFLSQGASISMVCQKLGISRQMYYRWIWYDETFNKNSKQATMLGIEVQKDFYINQLRKHAENGSVPATIFQIKRLDEQWEKHNPPETEIGRKSKKQLEVFRHVSLREMGYTEEEIKKELKKAEKERKKKEKNDPTYFED